MTNLLNKYFLMLISNKAFLIYGFIFLGFFLLFRPAPSMFSSAESLDDLPGQLHSHSNKKIIGIDVSHYQGNVDWPLAVNDISFVYLKATEGASYVDPLFKQNSQALTQGKVLAGAYHFYEPGVDPVKQADHFISTVSESTLSLRPVLDIEVSKGMTKKDISAGALKWLQRVEGQINCRPMIYTYASFWDSYLGPDFNKYPFWLADYTNKVKTPESRSDWALWQYSDSNHIKGIKSKVDAEHLNGQLSDMSTLMCDQ